MRFYVIATLLFCVQWSATSGSFVVESYQKDADAVVDRTNSGIKDLTKVEFNEEKVEIFIAKDNLIRVIPDNFFSKAKILYTVDLSNNAIKNITSDAFKGADRLLEVGLSDNSIKMIAPDAFEHHKDLVFVDLKNNELKEINFKFASLAVLHMENNPLRYLRLPMENSAKQIFFSWDRIESLDLPEGNQLEISVSKDFNGVKSVSDEKSELYCTVNSFKKLTTFKANTGTNDTYLQSMTQCLTNSLKSLVLSGSVIEDLSQIKLLKFSELDHLDISNTQLERLDLNSIQKSTKLKWLDISNNNLKHLDHPGVLSRFQADDFEFLASGNDIDNVNDIIRSLSKKAVTIDLSGSKSVKLDGKTNFNQFTALRTLKLRDTELQLTNKMNPFADCKKLDDLDLGYNNLLDVDFTKMGITLNRLGAFSCAHCQIEDINELTQTFKHPNNVRSLDLTGNTLSSITPLTFAGLRSLEILVLSESNVLTLDAGALKPFLKLQRFFIASNELATVDFKYLPKSIIELDLNNNNLKEIHNLNPSDFPRINTLGISKNELPCEMVTDFVKGWNAKKGFNFKGIPHEQKSQNCNDQTQPPATTQKPGNSTDKPSSATTSRVGFGAIAVCAMTLLGAFVRNH